MRKLVPVIMLSLLALGLVGCGAVAEETPTPLAETPFSPVISVTGEVAPAVWASISAETGGMVKVVTADVDDEVTAGELLVQLSAADAQVGVEQAAAALEVARAQLALAKLGHRPEEIAVAQAQVDAAGAAVSQAAAQRDELGSGAIDAEIASARAQVAAAESEQLGAREAHEQTQKCHNITLPDGSQKHFCPNLGTVEEQARQNLHAMNEALAAARSQLGALVAGSGQRQRVAQAAVEAAEAQQEVTRVQLRLLQAGPLDEQIAVAEANVAQAEAALEAARTRLAPLDVSAPFDGTIGAVHVRAGEFVAPGQPLVTLGDLTTLRVETTDLDEVDVARVEIGQPASIAFDALPETVFTGHVAQVAPMASSGGGGVNYAVIIELDQIAPVIRWGMTAFVDIEVD